MRSVARSGKVRVSARQLHRSYFRTDCLQHGDDDLAFPALLYAIIMSTNGPRRSARQSTFPAPNAAASGSAIKNRHLSHLHSQLAQLSANLSDLENLLRITTVQADAMRGLGGYCGSLYVHLLELESHTR